MKHTLVSLAAVAILVGAIAALSAGAISADSTSTVGFGMDSGSVSRQVAAGVPPDYGTFWIGPWTLTSGWGGPDAQMVSMKSADVTPAIHFYYWGDDISATCLENGCWSSLHNTQKTRANWDILAQQFVDHLNAKMAGEPVVILLETEFNKGGVATYEPLDGYLAEKAAFFHQHYPAAKVVMALGNWNSAAWGTWDRTAAASDYTGIQGLRSSIRQPTTTAYMDLDNGLLAGAKTLQTKFGKPIFVQDIGFSSYPEPEYLGHQANGLKEVFAALPELKAAGVMAIIYRTWTDNPNMNLANYHGEAERHWGFAWSGNLTHKPSAKVWIDGVKAERAGSPAPAPSPTPIAVGSAGVSTEAESFATKSTGGLQSEAAASGGKSWNLWSNGHVQQAFEIAAGEYQLSIRARGTVMDGIGPRMVVTLAGATLLVVDPGTAYADVSARIETTGALADLRISFTNDARSTTEDRNLLLDRVSFAPLGRAPIAAFTANVQDLGVALDASTSSDPDGDALTFAWAFGDGATGAGATTAHTYARAGTYAVTLTVSDARQSATSTQSVTATAPNGVPVAAFAASIARLALSVDGSASSDPDGDALSYAWVFGDGATATGRTAGHSYASAGTYTVVLTVSDGRASSSATKSVIARNPFTASFTPSENSNKWWVEVEVAASEAPAKVEAKVNDKAWVTLSKTDWGTWAKSMNAPQGSTVTFRATSASGEVVTSAPFTWLKPAMTATFTPKSQTNNWWVETKVQASETVARVEVRLNGGTWIALSKTDWGSWAKSMPARDGTRVEFRATGISGATVTSGVFVWG